MIQHVLKPTRRRKGKKVVSRIWWGQYRLPGERKIKRVSLHTSDKRVAEQRLKALVREREHAKAGVGVAETLRDASAQTVAEHLERFISDLEARRRSGEYVRHVRSRIRTLAGECGWEQLGDITGASFTAWRSQRTNAPKTLNDYLDAGRGFLEWLKQARQILDNPLANVPKVET